MAKFSFLSTIICLLWVVFLSWMCAADQDGIIEKKVLVGHQVNLTCQLNSSDVIEWWFIPGSAGNLKITTCPYNQDSEHDQCEPPPTYFAPSYKFHATLQNDTSILSLTASQDEPNIQCRRGDVVQRNYKLISIDPSDIVPNCTVALPSSDEDGVLGMALSCGVQSGLGIIFTFEGIGLDIPDTPGSSQSLITKTLHLEDFSNIHNASCNAYVPGFNITRSCNYPNIVKTQYITEGNDIIVDCDLESDVDLHLLDLKGKEEDIKNRSWTREGGRSVLIRGITKQDVGKLIICQTRGYISNGTIMFTIFSEIPKDTSTSKSEESKPVLRGNSPFFVPTMLFLALWLISTAIFGTYWGCKHPRNKSRGTRPNLNQSPNSGSNVNGSADETPLDLGMTVARRDPETLNTNNSANNPALELEEDGTDMNGLNRQSNNGSHLYFTLEKPYPSIESFRRASTSGKDCHEDTNLASLNQPQSSHWQGYETVGESDKGAACSYDLGEYAEVGDHITGRSLPAHSFRPSIPKKPGKEEIKNDISKLYSQVNK